MELAYTHPRLLFEHDEDDERREVVDGFRETRSSASPKLNSFVERNRELTVTYVDDNSIELLDATKETALQPRTFSVKRTAFTSIEKSADETLASCKLVGKVNPNLIKTWEQLNASNPPKRVTTTAQRPQQLQSEDFYDSIDDDQLVSELERIPSMCDVDDYNDLLDDDLDLNGMDEVMFDGRAFGRRAAGEVMAQFESMDKRKICWSMDSEKILN